MIKNISLTMGGLFLFSGCTIFQPDFGVAKQPSTVKRQTVLYTPNIEKRVVIKKVPRRVISRTVEPRRVVTRRVVPRLPKVKREIVKERVEVIPTIFTEELYAPRDTKSLIRVLNAFDWEKNALYKAYKQKNRLWTKNEMDDFLRILNEDKYLSLCGDKRYMDNLIFTENPLTRDLLYSILLLKYANNLSNGCMEWVSSDGRVLDENREEHIRSNYLLSMLSKNILIDRLFTNYIPKERDFIPAVKRYKLLTKYLENSEEIKSERLMIEQYKSFDNHPNYD